MNVGDRVRDKTRGIKGTIVQIEAAPGQTKRVLIQADPTPGSAPNAPHSRVWQMVTQVELIDRNGDAVRGKPGASLPPPTADQPHPASALGTGTNYDTAGKAIEAH